MSIRIAGATGFLGRRLLTALSHEVSSLMILRRDTRNLPSQEQAVWSSRAKIGPNHSVNAGRGSCYATCSTLIHLASESAPSKVHDPTEAVRVTDYLVSYCKSRGIRRIIFASTGRVHGESVNPVAIQHNVLQPESDYALGKVRSERLIRDSGLDFLILRIHNIYGVGSSARSVLPRIVGSALYGMHTFTPNRRAHDENVIDFIHADDVVEVFKYAALTEWSGNTIANIGSGTGFQATALYDALRCLPDLAVPSIRKSLQLVEWPGAPIREVATFFPAYRPVHLGGGIIDVIQTEGQLRSNDK